MLFLSFLLRIDANGARFGGWWLVSGKDVEAEKGRVE
jgi:hypothetical protein